MAGVSVGVDSATQTSDVESDNEDMCILDELPNASPRVVIDTSPPFGSVEEAVIRFGGRGFWIPGSVFAVDAATTAFDQNEVEVSDINKLEMKAAAMLKDLQLKEKETHEILQELELTKRLVEELKLKLSKESHECKTVPCLGFDKYSTKKDSVDFIDKQPFNPKEPTELIMMELKQTKQNLYQNTNELAAIRASVESLSKKMENKKSSVEKGGNCVETVGRSAVNPLATSREFRELNYEADQFMKTAEAAKSEVIRAISEIDQTKTGLKVIELRWLTAKKLEEAARAAESLAIAEIRALSSNESVAVGRISLSLEEYSALTDKARKADMLRKIEAVTEGSTQSNSRKSIPTHHRRDSRLLDGNEFDFVRNEPRPKTRPTTSIGQILSRKLVMRDGVEKDVGARERVSLNQILHRHRGDAASPQRRRENDSDESRTRETRGLFSKRKGLGLVHISFPLSKHGKNKIQALNHW